MQQQKRQYNRQSEDTSQLKDKIKDLEIALAKCSRENDKLREQVQQASIVFNKQTVIKALQKNDWELPDLADWSFDGKVVWVKTLSGYEYQNKIEDL